MSTWQDLITAALIGTERASVPATVIPGLPRPADAPDMHVPDDPAALLLDRAALLTAARRAGRQPWRADPLPVAGPDPAPAVNPAAARRLARMLRGEHPELLAEWLAAAAARGRRAPARLLPPLLDRARYAPPAGQGTAALRRLAAEVGGSRARWLAGLNPEWEFLLAGALAGDDAWRLGTAAERRDYLTAVRARDPGTARELVAGSWQSAAAGERAMFLSVLAGRLEPADEPLLEAALDDRAEEVRGAAARLLARLPGSALGRRMAGRAVRCAQMEHGPRGPHLVIVPPAGPDAAMRRDGITAGRGAGRSQPGDRTRLMLEIMARTPLRTWTEEFGLPAAQIIAAAAGGWAPVLFTGWARAAIGQQDQQWMTALITGALAGRPGAAESAALRQLARRADPRLGAPGALSRPGPEAPPATREAVRVLRFRYEMLEELDDEHGDG